MSPWRSSILWLAFGGAVALGVSSAPGAGTGLVDHLIDCVLVLLAFVGALAILAVEPGRGPQTCAGLGPGLLVVGLGALAWLIRGVDVLTEPAVQSAARVMAWSASPMACAGILAMHGRLSPSSSSASPRAGVTTCAATLATGSILVVLAIPMGLDEALASASPVMAAASLIVLSASAVGAIAAREGAHGGSAVTAGLLLWAAAQVVLITPSELAPRASAAAGALVAAGCIALCSVGVSRIRRTADSRIQVALARPMLVAGVLLLAWFVCGMARDTVYDACLRTLTQAYPWAVMEAHHSHALYFGAAGVAVPIVLLLGFRELRRRTHPLVALAEQADSVLQGGREFAPPTGVRDETGTVIRMFNVLLDALREGEAEIRQSVSLTRDIIEGMPFGVVIADREGKVRRANQAVLDLLRLDTESQILGVAALGPSSPPGYDLAPDLNTWDHAVAHEETVVAADGTEVPVLRTVLPLHYSQETLVLNAYVSIMDQKNALRDLERAQIAIERNARERMSELTRIRDDLARLIETASAPIIGLDTSGRINEWNTMAAFITGYFRDEAIGRDLVEMLVPEGMQGRAREVFEATLSGDSTRSFECPVRTHTGRLAHLLLNWTTRRDNAGAVVGVVIVGQDITERKEAEEQLARRARHQAAVAEFGHRALVAGDMDELLQEAVARVAAALECEYAGVLELSEDGGEFIPRAGIGWPEGEGTRVPCESGTLFAATLETDECITYEDLASEGRFTLTPGLAAHDTNSGMAIAIQGQDGPYGTMGVHTRHRREFTPDEVLCFSSFASALSAAVRRTQAEAALAAERANLEREVEARTYELRDSLRRLEDTNLLLQEANRHRSQFLASMSHELRTPLNGILGLAELLRGQFFGELNEQQLAYTTEIDRSGKRLLGLINDLLDMARLDASATRLELSQCRPVQFIDPAVSTLAVRLERRGVVVQPSIAPSVGFIEVDLAKCRQIMLHLLTNAAGAAQPGGVVTVTVGLWHEGCIRVSVHHMPGDTDALTDGDGAEELSLSMIRRLVEQHGGELGVDAAPETGTTVWFVLPQGDALRARHSSIGADSHVLPDTSTVAPGPAADSHDAEPPDPVRPRAILLVEDDEANVRLMVDMLTVGGHNVTVARTGEEALSVLDELPPDLAIVDLDLPGMSGTDVARRVSDDVRLRAIPLVALTGYSRDEVAEECNAAGFADILTKPVDLRSLHALVARRGHAGGNS